MFSIQKKSKTQYSSAKHGELNEKAVNEQKIKHPIVKLIEKMSGLSLNYEEINSSIPSEGKKFPLTKIDQLFLILETIDNIYHKSAIENAKALSKVDHLEISSDFSQIFKFIQLNEKDVANICKKLDDEAQLIYLNAQTSKKSHDMINDALLRYFADLNFSKLSN